LWGMFAWDINPQHTRPKEDLGAVGEEGEGIGKHLFQLALCLAASYYVWQYYFEGKTASPKQPAKTGSGSKSQ